jgi:SAM-dependent methyltransferase
VIGFPGAELALDPSLPWAERLYIRCLGVPINGLRIRLRRVLPATCGSYRRILDAGCGPGVFTMELAKRHPSAQVLGIDIDPAAVRRAAEIARRAEIRNCQFQVGDVTALGFRDEFDLVVSVDNLEHIDDDVGALANLCHALKSGGRLVLHTPNYYRRWLVLGRRVNFEVPGHARPGYHAEDLQGKLRLAGFSAVETRATYGILETFTNNVSYIITKAERRNKGMYALILPLLLGVSYLGKFSQPRWGAGLLATATRP